MKSSENEKNNELLKTDMFFSEIYLEQNKMIDWLIIESESSVLCYDYNKVIEVWNSKEHCAVLFKIPDSIVLVPQSRRFYSNILIQCSRLLLNEI